MNRLSRSLTALALSCGTAMAVLPPASAHAATVPPRIAAYNWAVTQRGKPYAWGAAGPWGYDCSGLVYSAYHHVLPRTTYGMLASGKLIWERTHRRGDLAFFGSGHVEIYAAGHVTIGAQTSGTLVGWHVWNAWWHPTSFYRVAGAG